MNVLVIAAHPDDEILGCGGAMAKHALAGDKVQPVILSEGATSRDSHRNRDFRAAELKKLKSAAEAASEELGVCPPQFHDFPDNRMDGMERLDVTKAIESDILKFKPDIIYSHHAGDVNIDHRVIHEAIIPATRPLPDSSIHTLLFFEVASSTEWQPAGSAPVFSPNWFVDISKTLDLKLRALECYSDEMRNWPHPRSIRAVEHLARWRGASIGTEAAEAFVLGRNLS